jgi:hypothetical protein
MKDKGDQTPGGQLSGTAWAFPSLEAARTVCQEMQAKPAFLAAEHDCLLSTGVFQGRAVLSFLWAPNVDRETVDTVVRLVRLGGGEELQEPLEQELLRQIRLRRRALRNRQPLDRNILRHYPRGRSWKDLKQ